MLLHEKRTNALTMKYQLCMGILWFATVASVAQAAPIEEVVQIPVEVTDEFKRPYQQTITVTVFRDDARGRSPFLVLNHGRAGTSEERLNVGRARYAANSQYFVARGFTVFVPTRVGYGVSGGPDVEDTGVCHNKDFPRGFEVAAGQTLAILTYAKSLPYVDGSRGLLVGQSFGGATTVALAAKNLDGVKGAINFAGGSGGNPTGRPEDPCSAALLAQTYANYGKSAKTQMLWLYSENDKYWGKEYPRDWFEHFIKHGGNAQFVQLPPSGRDGHGSFTANPSAWRPQVENFMKSLGFAD